MPVGLDAGPVLNLSGPKGVHELPLRAPGSYSNQFSSNAAQVEYLQAGDYVVDNGAGGRDVGPFKATLKIPQPLNATIQRSANATMVTWTGSELHHYDDVLGRPKDQARAAFVAMMQAGSLGYSDDPPCSAFYTAAAGRLRQRGSLFRADACGFDE